MSSHSDSRRQQRSRKRLWLLGIPAALVLLLLAAILVLTNQAFLKKFILPRIAARNNVRIQAERIRFRPWGSLSVAGLDVRTADGKPFFKAASAAVDYNLLALIRGDIDLGKVALQSPSLRVVQNEDGSTTLDAFLAKSEEETALRGGGALPSIHIASLSVRDGRFEFIATGKSATRISGLSVDLSELGQNRTAKLRLQAAVDCRAAQTNRLGLKVSADWKLDLGSDLLPRLAAGRLDINVPEGEGTFAELRALQSTLQCDMTPKRIKEASLAFAKNGTALGSFRLSGVLPSKNTPGQLKYVIQGIDRNCLNLLGAPFGLDFGQTQIQGNGTINLGAGGSPIAVAAGIAAKSFSLRRGDLAIPPLDLNVSVGGDADLDMEQARIRELRIEAKQNGRPLLAGSLDRTMNLIWNFQRRQSEMLGAMRGEAVQEDAIFSARLTGLDLEQWRSLFPDPYKESLRGKVWMDINITNQMFGVRFAAGLTGRVENLSLRLGTNRVENALVRLRTAASVEDFRLLTLDGLVAEVEEAGRRLLEARGSASYDLLQEQGGQIQVDFDAPLTNLLALAPAPQLQAQRGTLHGDALFSYTPLERSVDVSLALNDFTGKLADFSFKGHRLEGGVSAELRSDYLNLRRIYFSSHTTGGSAGGLDISGQLNRENNTGSFRYHITGVDEKSLQPFLAPYLPEGSLLSATIEGDGAILYRTNMNLQIDGGISLKNLRVASKTPSTQETPLDLGAELHLSFEPYKLRLQTNVVILPTSAMAENRLYIDGLLDFSATNHGPSTLDLQAKSLNLTPLYELAMALSSPSGASRPLPEQPAPTGPLLIEPFTAQIKIGRLYLRQLVAENWNATLRIENGRARLAPCTFKLNDAPVSLETAFNPSRPAETLQLHAEAEGLPLAPLAASFLAAEPGEYVGDLFGSLDMKTAPNAVFPQNLEGQGQLTVTNLALRVLPKWAKDVLVPTAAALRAPELISSLPEYATAVFQAGNGVLQIKDALVASRLFIAQPKGTVRLAADPAQCQINLPVDFALSVNLLRRMKIQGLPQGPLPGFANLPNFVQVKGTLAAWKTQINQTALAGLLAGASAATTNAPPSQRSLPNLPKLPNLRQ